jgi:hypothetical protein
VTKRIAALAFALSLFSGIANAQTCSAVPNNLTNGSTADATQVMANFSYALNCINGLRGYLGGLTMSNDGSSPNTVIDTSAGVADSDDVTTMMTLGAFTKNANAAWATGTANGCLDSGSALAVNTWYHLFVIGRTDTGVVDELCSTSATSPTTAITGWPSGSTKKRRIGSFKTDGSGHILGFSQNGDEFLWKGAVEDVNTTIGTTPTLFPLPSVPPGVKVNALVTTAGNNPSPGPGYILILLNSPDQTAVNTNIPGGNVTVSTTGGLLYTAPATMSVRTDTSQNLRGVANTGGTVFTITTLGWVDTRGRFN